jgi:hypothetical protein
MERFKLLATTAGFPESRLEMTAQIYLAFRFKNP